ncbi:MAG: hypothetical protein V4658_13240 [Bacteroidota bacterium]
MSNKVKAVLFIVFTLVGMAAYSQPPNQGDPSIFEEIDDVPIDGAIALLTIAGTGLGIKKLYHRKK